MKNFLGTLTLCLAAIGAFALALPASAQTLGVSASVNASVTARPLAGRLASTTRAIGARMAMSASTTAARIAQAQQRADTEIQNRITTLSDLASRIEAMVKLSDSEKASLSASLQSEITNLTSLGTHIDVDTSTTTLRSDMQSITQAYRIYALVVPQGSIIAAADRINTLVTSFTTIGTKIQARDSSADLTDFNAKISDASAQASAATAEVANLQPDNGDQTILASNTAALKDARSKIKTATQDLQAARQDAETIIKSIESSAPSASVNASASTTTQ